MMKNYTVEYLSGVFCFVQTRDGKVVSVHAPRMPKSPTSRKGLLQLFKRISKELVKRLRLILNHDIAPITGRSLLLS
jgi:hypothetical protein